MIHRSLTLYLCLSLVACTASPVTSPSSTATGSTQLSQDIRPGTKGQRLEFVEGELVIPAGTNSFILQSEASSLAQASVQILNFLMPPALAQTEAEAEFNEEDAPITQAELELLTATVDGQSVEVEILSVTEDPATSDQIVAYRLKDVELTGSNVLIEFSSPSGALKLGGVLPPFEANTRRINTRLDLDSTAVAQVVRFYLEQQNLDLRKLNLSRTEIEALIKTETAQMLRNQIYNHYVKPQDQKKPQRFDQAIPVKDFITDQFGSYIQKLSPCLSRRNPRTCAKPAPPQQMTRALPQETRAFAQVRIQKRLQLRPEGTPPADTRLPNGADLRALIGKTTEERRDYCRENRVFPCPDNKATLRITIQQHF